MLRAKKTKLIDTQRRLMIQMMYLDWKLLGYRSETVNQLAARIRREKQEQKK